MKEIISDFIVRLGFDGKDVLKGVAESEAALKRLKKIKLDTTKSLQNTEFAQAVKATKQMIQGVSVTNRLKRQQAAKDASERRKEQVHLKRLLSAKASLRRSVPLNTAGLLSPEQEKGIRGRISKATTVEQLRDIRAEMGRIVTQNRLISKEMAKHLNLNNALKFSIGGIVSSLKNLARSWVSIFAVISGAIAGLKFTQEFKALEASMLAVSDSVESSAKNVEFIKKLSLELPINISRSADEFRNLLSSGRSLVGEQEIKNIFRSLAEYGAALQVDPERMSRAMVAIGQMFNKTTLSAEEVKNQLGENLPGSLNLMAKSIGKDVPSFLKMMETGSLLAKDVIPKFAKEASNAAKNNDALNKSLNTSRSQWTIFVNKFKLLFDGFGSSRLDKGVANFTKGMSKLLKVVKPFAQIAFYLIGVLVDLAAVVLNIGSGAFNGFLSVIRGLSSSLKKIGNATNLVNDTIFDFLGDLANVGIYFVPFLRWFAIIGDALEEFVNIFTGHVQGIVAGTGDTIGERLKNGIIGKGFAKVWDYLKEWMKSLPEHFYNIGKNMGSSLVNGIKASIGDIKEFLTPDWLKGRMFFDSGPPLPPNSAPNRKNLIQIFVDGAEKFNQEIEEKQQQQLYWSW